MSNIPSESSEGSDVVPLLIVFPPHAKNIHIAIAEDGGFPTVEDIVPHKLDNRSDFSKLLEADPRTFKSVMKEADLVELKAKYGLPHHIELIPAGWNKVQVHCLGYCAFYAYPFYVGYTLPLLPLVEELCHYYGV